MGQALAILSRPSPSHGLPTPSPSTPRSLSPLSPTPSPTPAASWSAADVAFATTLIKCMTTAGVDEDDDALELTSEGQTAFRVLQDAADVLRRGGNLSTLSKVDAARVQTALEAVESERRPIFVTVSKARAADTLEQADTLQEFPSYGSGGGLGDLSVVRSAWEADTGTPSTKVLRGAEAVGSDDESDLVFVLGDDGSFVGLRMPPLRDLSD